MTKEEAIRRIKSWNLDSDDMEVLSVVIPELAESEDEKIRKELLEEIEFIIPHEDETNSEGEILPSYHTRIDRYKSYLEKQKEQKPAEWSEKDKDYYDAIIAKLEVTQDDAMLTDNQMDFLKSLPERLNLQPKQEWNEKDNIMLDNIILCLKEYCLTDEINWLKSLRPPQYCENCKLKRSVENWKPSEEQMYILNWVANILLNHDCIVEKEVAKKLQSLYNDLQKLL